jgi:hypothetical protein
MMVIVITMVTIITGSAAPLNDKPMDPVRIAECETGLLKAYLAKDQKKANAHLKILIEEVCGVPDATTIVPLLTKAMDAFNAIPEGSKKEDYLIILPPLITAFEEIKKTSRYSAFDPVEAAKAELDWWVVRRLPAENNNEHEGSVIAKAFAAFYGGDVKDYGRSAYIAASEAIYSDLCQNQLGGMKESDWAFITQLLTQSYIELKNTLEARLQK